MKKIWEKVITNPWLVGIILLDDLWMLAQRFWSGIYGWLSKHPPPSSVMLSIDWLDFGTKCLLCLLIVSLQRLVIRSRSDQLAFRVEHEKWRKEQTEWTNLEKKLRAIGAFVTTARNHVYLSRITGAKSPAHAHYIYSLSFIAEWDECLPHLVGLGIVKDEAEGNDLLARYYSLDRAKVEAGIKEWEAKHPTLKRDAQPNPSTP